MKKRDFLIIFILSLAVNLVPFIFQAVPGYMDAEYYYAGGLQLIGGQGFYDPFIWNYLGNPGSLPVPSHAYWMPLASLVAATGLFLFHSKSFLAAKSLFLILASIYPCLTASLSYRLHPKKGIAFWVAGVSLFSGFYIVFFTLTESFILYAVLGSILFHLLISLENQSERLGIVFFCGLTAGGLHLSRADGILWLFFLIGTLIIIKMSLAKKSVLEWLSITGKNLLTLLGGYFLVTGFWYIRNISQWGSAFPPGGTLTLWITNYDQIFIYPGSLLTFNHWAASGIGSILSARLSSLGINLATVLSVQGLVLLIPAMIAGVWVMRKKLVTQVGFGMWLVTLLVMSFAFPYAGARGGFLHSVTGVQPMFLAVSGIGMQNLIEKLGAWRKWKTHQAFIVLSSGILVICAAISAYLVYQRILRPVAGGRTWGQSFWHYADMGKAFTKIVNDKKALVAVNDPPGFYLATGLECVVIPDGDMSSLAGMSKKYGVDYLIIEENTVKYLVDAYDHPGDRPGLKYLANLDGGYLYEIQP